MYPDKHVERSSEYEQVATYGRPHEAQHAHYSHEMPDETKEASGRFVLRVVPLLYGVLLGGLTDNLAAGVCLGALVSFGLDLSMGQTSIFRAMSCPFIAAFANGFGRAIAALGLRVPSFLRGIECGVS